MVAELGTKCRKRLRERLWPAREYHGACAELRGGLLLRSAGAALVWEPIEGRKGPDWLARWIGGSLAVEVKAPRQSMQSKNRQTVLTEFLFAFMSETLPQVDAGVWLTLHPGAAILEAKTIVGSPDLNAVRLLATEAADAIRQNMPRPTVAGRFSAGRSGEFSIALGAGEEPKVNVMMSDFNEEPEHDAKRIFAMIEEAAVQLRGMAGSPGLVIVDAEDDFTVVKRIAGIEDALRSETWAAELAGVAIVTRTGTVDDVLGEIRSDAIVHIVPGPQAAALVNTLLTGLRTCDRGHFHVDPLMTPTKHCQLRW